MKAFHIVADNIRLSPNFYLTRDRVVESLQIICIELGEKYNSNDAIKLHQYAIKENAEQIEMSNW
jgi:hypothetical protein